MHMPMDSAPLQQQNINNISTLHEISNYTTTTSLTTDVFLCNLHHEIEVTKFFVTLLLNFGAVLVTSSSIIMSFLNKEIDPQIRGILLSYSTADFIGRFQSRDI